MTDLRLKSIALLGAELDVKRGEQCLRCGLGAVLSPEIFKPGVVEAIKCAWVASIKAVRMTCDEVQKIEQCKGD